ncbi:MAG: HEAT repeat domain-containing protein [Methylococcaceae bacterium]|nr:HEAT repeat domain-containing protein [Methylococcaceae bacterium]
MLDFVSTTHKGSEYRLEVRQMPLGQVLKRIEAETQVPIHYSVLPEGLVTATCVGSALKTILECLLDRKADLIVRYSADKIQSNGTILETWVLGSRLDGAVARNCPVPLEHYIDATTLPENQQEEEVARLRTQELLKMARSENPEERASAIGAFLSEGGEDDPEITAALEHALTDEDGNVRAQAVSNLSHRGDNASNSSIVQEALQDSSPDVRMMAVDSITDDEALLRLAIQDSDETVRSLAGLKLEQLTQDNNAVK